MFKVKPAVGIWLVSLIWIGAVGGIWFMHEYGLKNGTEVELKAVPVDPRDFFRGDYVILRYAISSLSGSYDSKLFKRNKFVYVPLVLNNGMWTSGVATVKRPSGLSIKGRVRANYGNTLQITYGGIESFFVPEGQGLEYEKAQTANRLYAIMNIQKNGNANLKRLVIK